MFELIRAASRYRVYDNVALSLIKRCRRCSINTEVIVKGRASAVVEEGRGLGRIGSFGGRNWFLMRGLVPDEQSTAEGHSQANSSAKLNATISLWLAKCPSCEKRGWLSLPLAMIVAAPYSLLGAVPAGIIGAGISPTLHFVQSAAVAGAMLAFGFAAGFRLAQADGATSVAP